MNLVNMIKMSSKGQVVIPAEIRDNLRLETGTKFVIWAEKDTVLLKKIGKPSSEGIDRLFKRSSEYAKNVGLRKADIADTLKELRKK